MTPRSTPGWTQCPASACTVNGADEKAYKQAERKLTALMAEIDRQRGTPSMTTLGYVIDEWLRTAEIKGTLPQRPPTLGGHATVSSKSRD